jgi:hypothetical protein
MALLAGVPGKLDNDEEVENNERVEFRMDAEAYSRLRMLKFLIESMTGKKIKFMGADRKDGDDLEIEGAGYAQEPGEAERSIEYHHSEYRFEQEVLIFEASGVINTAGGAKTSFAIKFTMTRTYYSERTFGLVVGEGGDGPGPLVNASSSSGTAFSALGSMDTDPAADDSSELFGTGDGSGFKGLAIYGPDANNRIDENGPIYKRLYVMVAAPDGEEHWIPLKEAGIGAIYLDYAETRFALKDGADSFVHEVVKTGAYVNDNGRIDTVQQVNVIA